jgi:hypothetical protein
LLSGERKYTTLVYNTYSSECKEGFIERFTFIIVPKKGAGPQPFDQRDQI